MSKLKSLLYNAANLTETSFDRLAIRLRERVGMNSNLQIVPYTTYGTSSEILVRGRVLVNKSIAVTDNDQLLENLQNSYKRFFSSEVAGAKVRITFSKSSAEVETDEDGYFDHSLKLVRKLPPEELWFHPLIELTGAPVHIPEPVAVRARVMVPPGTATFGIISDIDDTVLKTDATNLLKAAYQTFLGNAHSRIAFDGVAAFYKALQEGPTGGCYNPVFYISSSPWNLYDLLWDFMKVNSIPAGPLLLKDYGFTHKKLFSESHEEHKLKQIRTVMHKYPKLPFILIGDSGQKDPEIYRMIAQEFIGRITAIYIRDVSLPDRDIEVKDIITGLFQEKVEMVMVADTYAAALHAAEKGLLKPSALPFIQAEKKLDQQVTEVEKAVDQAVM